MEEYSNSNVIISTPEKWDAFSRKWRNNLSLVKDLELLLLDEMQHLQEAERGGVLEAVVSRMVNLS